jgi:lauroyl/myristoyl acyltransferase
MTRYWLLRLLVAVGGRLPVRVAYAIAWLAGALVWRLSSRLREVTRDHARHALGLTATRREVDRVARGALRANFFYYADFARLAHHRDEAIFDVFDEVRGLEHLYSALDRGRGVVLVSAHLGNGEFLAPMAAPFGICLAVVTERLQPLRLHDYVHRIRGARGVRFLPADAAGLRAAVQHLRSGGALGLLVDRDVLGTAPLRPFFSERAPIPTGAVDLALRTGAPVIAAWIPRTGVGRYAIHLEPVTLPALSGDRAADAERAMAVMVRAIEGGIRRWPDQWFVLTPIWGRAAERAPKGRRGGRGQAPASGYDGDDD